MKNVIYSFIFLMVIFSSCTKKNDIKQENKSKIEEKTDVTDTFDSQNNYLYKYTVMYVNSPEGLNVRNAPNIGGNKTGVLKNLTEVLIIDEDSNNINIDGIDGKWVQILIPVRGWVFSGYLGKKQVEKKITKENITGEWRIIDQQKNYNKNDMFFVILDFMKDGRCVYGQYATGFGFFGKWNIIDDKTIELYGAWSSETSTEEELVYKTIYLERVKYIDNNLIMFYNGFEGTFDIMEGLRD